MSKKLSLVVLSSIATKALNLIYKRKNSDTGVDKMIPAGISTEVLVEIRAVVEGEVFQSEFVVPVQKGHATTAKVTESPDLNVVVAHLLDRMPQDQADDFLKNFPRLFEKSGNDGIGRDPVTLELVESAFKKVKYDTGKTIDRSGAIATPKELGVVKRRSKRVHKLA